MRTRQFGPVSLANGCWPPKNPRDCGSSAPTEVNETRLARFSPKTPMKFIRLLPLACAALLAQGARGDSAPATPPTTTAISPLPPGVNLRAATVKVIVVPDHRDWTY